MGTASLDEIDVSDKDGDPSQDAEDGGQVDKVLENFAGVITNIHESEEGEEGAEEQRRPGYTTAISLLENSRGRAVRGKAVESSAGDVEIGVGGREDEDQDTSVDDVGEDLDTSNLGGDNKGRGAGTGPALSDSKGQIRRVVRDNHSNEEDTETVEEEDAVEGKVDGLRDAATRVLGLAGCDTDQLSAKVGKSGVDHDGPEAKELTGSTIHVKSGKSAGVRPVLEAGSLSIGATTAGNDQGEKNYANNDNDLDRGQPKLKLAKELDATKIVDAEDDDDEDGDEHTRIDLLTGNPVLDDKSGGGELVGSDDDIFEPVTKCG